MSFDAPSKDYSGCPSSPEYQNVIDFAAKNTYNPELLGDIDKLKNKYNCKISSPSEAVDLAVQALREADPSIQAYKQPEGLFGPGRAGIGSGIDFKNGELKLSKVIPGSPADIGDLKAGDKILSIDGKPISKLSNLDDVHKLITAEKSILDGNVGIGMSRKENGALKISQVVPKLAADSAGLMEGDAIVAINGNAVSKNESIDTLNKSLQGREGSKVHLLVERNGERFGLNLARRVDGYPTAAMVVERDGKTFETTVPRRAVDVQPVVSKHGDEELTPGGPTLPQDTTYIKVNNFFGSDTTDRIWKALQEQNRAADGSNTTSKDGARAKSVIVDLRDNVGGRIDDIVLTASLFVNKGDLYSLNTRVNSNASAPSFETETVSLNEKTAYTSRTTGGVPVYDGKPPVYTHDRMPLAKRPDQLIVLVNEQTSGSAEMLAEALKVNAGATVVGTETKGYGITQIANPVSRDTMLILNTGHLMSPGGRWFGNGTTIRNGVAPDVRVNNSDDAEAGSNMDEQVKAAIKLIADKRK